MSSVEVAPRLHDRMVRIDEAKEVVYDGSKSNEKSLLAIYASPTCFPALGHENRSVRLPVGGAAETEKLLGWAALCSIQIDVDGG
jgi:hypothetical protein